MSHTVVIVEDDVDAAEIVRLYLARDGHKVLLAHDGVEGLRLARESSPDLVVLDLMLPGMDGMQVCRALRAESDVAVVMLTARAEEQDRLAGLEYGADDYVTKPFSPRELAARVRGVLRRTARDAWEAHGPAELHWREIRIKVRERTARVGDEQLRLTPTEFRLLAMFLRSPERVFTRDEIINHAFIDDYDGFDRTVDVHISNLRKKLERAGSARCVHTVYGVGYRWGDA